MISSSTPGIAWPAAEDERILARLGELAVSSAVASSTRTMSPGEGLSSTGAHVARWSRNCSICSRTLSSVIGGCARVTGTLRACELDLGADLDVQLEAQRLALLELEVVDMRL